MMQVTVVILILFAITTSAEVSSSYDLLQQHTVHNPMNAIPAADTEENKKEATVKDDHSQDVHPIYRPDIKNQGRVRIEPVRPKGPIINHQHEQMLADQPGGSTEINRIDNLAIPNYAYAPAPEVAYPDIPYAPGYGYDNGYSASNNYEYYNSPSNYLLEPDTTALGLLWSQVPDSRTIVSYVGRTIAWIFSSIFVLLLGSFLTVGVCSYTDLCSIHFHGVGPIHEEMRSLITPERLEKISTAADFVKNAIDKYQKIQKVAEPNQKRARRSIRV